MHADNLESANRRVDRRCTEAAADGGSNIEDTDLEKVAVESKAPPTKRIRK